MVKQNNIDNIIWSKINASQNGTVSQIQPSFQGYSRTCLTASGFL